MGREDEAIRMLIRNCTNVTETIEFALALNIADQQNMWDIIVTSSVGNTSSLNQLLEYVELIQ
jgi:hypothetical protein